MTVSTLFSLATKFKQVVFSKWSYLIRKSQRLVLFLSTENLRSNAEIAFAEV